MRQNDTLLSRYLFTSLAASIIVTCFLGTAVASTQPYISDHQINFGTGNKYHQETDVTISGPGQPLSFTRTYNSQGTESGELGHGWTATFAEKLRDITPTAITLIQAGGRAVQFNGDAANGWNNETGTKRVITAVAGGYQLKEPNGAIKLFTGAGTITSSSDKNNHTITYTYAGNDLTVSDNFGHSLAFDFNDTTGKLASLTSAAGTVSYGYTNDNLTTVTRQGEAVTTYIYDDPHDPHNLTGITETEILESGDPAGESSRVLTVGYDDQDRAIGSAKTGGQNEVTIVYTDSDSRDITRIIDGLPIVSTYELEVKYGIALVKSFTGPGCSSCGEDSSSSYTYTDRFQVERITNAEEVITYYQYDADGNKRFVTEAEGTAVERTTEYTYWPGTHLVWEIKKNSLSNLGQQHITTMTYDGSGNLRTMTETGFADPATALGRTTTYTYANGQLATIDGPRTGINDITVLKYYPNTPEEGLNRGQLWTVTNGLNQVVTYSQYNGLGKPERIVDANNVATDLQYNSRGVVTGRTTGTRTVVYDYDYAGRLDLVTLPDNRTLDYIYDGTTGWLERITDNLGNYLRYEYDTAGKQTKQFIYNANNVLKAQHEVSYDTSGRLHKILNPDLSFEELLYDGVDNLTKKINELGKLTEYDYDELNRITEIQEPRINDQGQSDPILTLFTYIAQAVESGDVNNSTVMTDDNGNKTVFVYDDFGRTIREVAPDTGSTSYTYDLADNLTAKVTAKTTVNSTYDVLNRLKTTVSLDGTVAITYQYDQNQYGIGRLAKMLDATGSSTYLYTQYGELKKETRVINGTSFATSYTYNNNSELTSVTYPSTRKIIYNRNLIGKVTSIVSAYQGENKTIANQIAYQPFGPLRAMTLSNGLKIIREHDLQYRLSASSAGTVFDRDYGYWPTGQVKDITDNLQAAGAPGRLQSYIYDDIGRLTNATGASGSLGYSYDGVGNRITKTTGSLVEPYSYKPGTNQLSQVGTGSPYGYDNVGNITLLDDQDFTWDGENRLTSVSKNQAPIATYGYDGRNLRTIKTTDQGTLYCFYDASGNLLSQATAGGAILLDYVYLDGERIALFSYPGALVDLQQVVSSLQVVGSVDGATAQDLTGEGRIELGDAILPLYQTTVVSAPLLFHYINDHLHTSQLITDGSGQVVWQGEYSPFGQVEVVVKKIGNDTRFPGQYYDAETGLHYNWHRFYDPETGRYISADPIGLDGEDLNLFAYVGGDPVNWFDPWGLMRLPGSPGGLPPEWKPDPTHKDPNGERYKHPNGDTLDWHPATPGANPKTWDGKDHWHHNGGKYHYPPGNEIPDPKSPDTDSTSEMCGETCQKTLIWTGVGLIAVCCTLQPELCLLGAAGGAAAY